MEASEEKSQLENEEQHPELGFQSDIADQSINHDELNQIPTQEFENVAISCEDEILNRDFPEHSGVWGEECEVKRVVEEEIYQLVVKEAVNEAFPVEFSGEGGDTRRSVNEALERPDVKRLPEENPIECRVLEKREVREDGLVHEKEVKGVDDDDEEGFEPQEDDYKGEHEFEIEDDHGSSLVLGNEYNDEEKRGNREVENGEELENESEKDGGWGWGGEGESGSVAVPNDGRPKGFHYPLRLDAEDCSYYMRTGVCKFGSTCKFNHPLRRRNQPSKETVNRKEDNSERPGQIECKFYLSSGGCKYGNACKYNHSRGRTAVSPVVEYNFLGLPVRPGEKECPYYMRNGSCKYGPNCKFNHPDPTAAGGGDAPASYGNGGSGPLQSASPTTMSSWSTPRTPNGAAPFLSVLYSPTHSMPLPNPDWNGYQAPAPVYPTSERSLPTSPGFFINNSPSNTDLYMHHQQQMLVSDFPERPGQLECSYYMKTGDCKYRSACKFHHPKNRIPKTVPSVLTNKGLPLRPDQSICTHYSRYGICKYGPACKYDHPINYSNPVSAGGYDQPDGLDASLTQQSV